MTSDPSASRLWSRRLVLVFLVFFLAWTGIQGLRELYRAGWYALADPWPAEAPVQWTLRGHHAQQLEAQATRLRPCLEKAGTLGDSTTRTIAVTTPASLGEQGFYLHLWLTYVLPEHDLRRVTRDEEGLAANAWLWLDSRDSPPVELGLEAICSSGNATLYAVAPPVDAPTAARLEDSPTPGPLTGVGTASSLVWAVLLFAVCVAIGWGPAVRWLQPVGISRPWLWAGIAGSLLAWLGLWLGDALGVPWSQPWLVGGGAASLLLSGWLARGWQRDAPTAGPDSAATPSSASYPRLLRAVVWLGPASALAALAAATACLWNVHPDFVFHWGAKGAKFFLHQGLDFTYLSRPWNYAIHPDYPNLIPGLEAAGATLAGAFLPRAAVFSSFFHALLLILAVIELATRTIRDTWFRALSIAAVSWAIAMFAISSQLAGGADLALAAAITAGAALLIQPKDPRSRDLPSNTLRTSLALAVVAAWAACTKLEGMPLAVALVALHLGQQLGTSGNQLAPLWRRGWASAALPAVVMIAWAAQTKSHGLFQAANTSSFDPSRWRLIVTELAHAASVDIWHLLPWALLALPLLVFDRSARWPALLCCSQLAFYLYAYFSGPVDTAFWIQTSAPRLFFHLLPVVWILLIAFAERRTRGARSR